MRKFLYILILIAAITSCKSVDTKTPSANAEESTHPFETIIKAQLVDVPSNLATYDTESICSKYPCDGMIVVQAISKTGQSYHGQFNAKDTILVHFNFTLSETNKDMFPYITKHFPGITKGQYFEAAVTTKQGQEDQLVFEINDYKILI